MDSYSNKVTGNNVTCSAKEVPEEEFGDGQAFADPETVFNEHDSAKEESPAQKTAGVRLDPTMTAKLAFLYSLNQVSESESNHLHNLCQQASFVQKQAKQ